ncbi:FHA domain-containing protein [Nocardia arizonensis]|uniref:FHA domain-containing protein n=1 Tax=Nocardia arizonensis TaxID=1141647 RepID=UPI0006D23E1B|nr:FHA domain-containing protein [Nocardia arizonensis]
MLVCPDGHRSLSTDYCDVCGSPLRQAAASPVTPQSPCPACGQPSGGRFCEACGHDSALGAVQPRSAAHATLVTSVPAATQARHVIWIAAIAADRGYYDRVLAREGPDADGVEFPSFVPERRIVLRGNEILIGKRSVSQGVHPDIDLGLAPADAGVSRSHAMLRLTATELTITDLGSTNGTSLNGGDDLIPAHTAVRLRSGDRIHLGAWTTITLSTEPG